MKVLLALFFAAALGMAAGPGHSYSRSFPGSKPAYFQIALDRGGNAEYREAPDDDNPVSFRLGEADAGEVFGLAEKLEYFKRPIESSAKVAFTGTKIFRYENGAQKSGNEIEARGRNTVEVTADETPQHDIDGHPGNHGQNPYRTAAHQIQLAQHNRRDRAQPHAAFR